MIETYSGHNHVIIYSELEEPDKSLFENFQWHQDGKVAFNTQNKCIIVRQAMSRHKYWNATKRIRYYTYYTVGPNDHYVRSFLANNDEDAMDQEATCK